MNNFSVIEVSDDRWSDIISKSLYSDFYHTQSYHSLEKEHRPVLLVVNFKDNFIALPLILRRISNSDYFDCTSVYGYCGPISNLNFDSLTEYHFIIFQQFLLDFFKERNVVAVFCRLHPIISHGEIFKNFGIVKDINTTVSIDLKISAEEQKKQYRKTNNSELNRLRSKGFEVFEAESKEEIDAFIAIYHETMHRVGASSTYFFTPQYFYGFLDNKCFKNKLLLAKKDGIIAAGALFTISKTILQYHLAGTTQEYIKEAPMKLIIDEARLIGNHLKLDFLHLGGGVGGSDKDSLFRFKAGFSQYRCFYQIWQMIVNPKKYDELVKNSNSDSQSSYFPLYQSVVKDK